LVLSVLQFVASPLRILENLSGCLAAGGMCVVAVPNAYGAYRLQHEFSRFGRAKAVQSSGQSEYGETTSFASHNLVSLFEAAGYNVQQIFRCHSKSLWAAGPLRERLYNFRSYLPGVLMPMLLPTMVGIGIKPDH